MCECVWEGDKVIPHCMVHSSLIFRPFSKGEGREVGGGGREGESPGNNDK